MFEVYPTYKINLQNSKCVFIGINNYIMKCVNIQ